MTICPAIALHWDAVTVIFIYWPEHNHWNLHGHYHPFSRAGRSVRHEPLPVPERGESGTPTFCLPVSRIEAFMLGPVLCPFITDIPFGLLLFYRESGLFGILELDKPGHLVFLRALFCQPTFSPTCIIVTRCPMMRIS